MKRKPVVVLAVVAALVAVGLWGYPRWTREKDPILSGTIESRDVQVGSLVGGRVAVVHVDEGATVHAGDPIVTLEPDLLDLQLREQQTVVDQARARLNLTLAGPRIEARNQARADWENAERERQRLEGLLKHGLIPQEQYDNSATAARIKREVLQEAERGSRKEDIEAARANVAQADARLAYLQRQRQETVVTAPADGVIQAFDLRPGDLVGANQPVATLLERNQLWVRVYVPETRLGLVHKGQAAAIRVDTFPNRTFPGKVVEIRDRGEYTPRNVQTVEQRSDLVFGVKVAIDPTPELKPGMAALVTLQPPEAAR
jgi:multidrug resistance efflux pump